MATNDSVVFCDKVDLIENDFQVTPILKRFQNMSAQVGVAFKESEGGLRNAALHSGSCVTLVCWSLKQRKTKIL